MPSKPMTRREILLGWCYLPFFIALLALVVGKTFLLLGIPLTSVSLNITCFSIDFLFIIIVFRRFLCQRFFGKGFFRFVKALFWAILANYTCMVVAALAADRFFADLTIYNDQSVQTLLSEQVLVFGLFSVFTIPIVEEVLIRGVVFGSIYRHSRFFAYVFSALLFAAMHVWQYVGMGNPVALLLNTAAYLPGGFILAWLYRKTDSIWAPILMHALNNALSFGVFFFLK